MDFLQSIVDRIQHRLAFVTYTPINWKGYVQAFDWGITLFETYLLIRQYPLYSKPDPPPALAGHFTPDVYKKSQEYGRDKAKFAIITGLLKQALDSAALQWGMAAWCWKLAGSAIGVFGLGVEYEITQSIFFVFILAFLSSLPTIPIQWYQTFVLEERHGFNKTTPSLFLMDQIKTYAISVVLGAPFLGSFLWIFKWAGDRFVPWLMGFMITFQMSMIVIYPTLIQPLFNKLSPLPQGDLRTRTEKLATRLNFPLKHLYEIDGSKRSSHSNAYFFGLPWAKHIVIFDTLMQQSKPDEVEAVLAHELGHWYHKHPLKLLTISQLHIFTILAAFPAFLKSPPLLRSFDFPAEVAKKPPTMVAFLLFQMILTPMESVIGACMNAISRHFEWEADHFACTLHERLADQAKASDKDKEEISEMRNMGDRLGRALITLHVKNLSTVWVDWMYSAYHHSHPTLTERLKELEAYKTEQQSKLKKAT
ncbi:hypothetical protein K523DRAFT_357144 [Schizophyllum commune Tattone D]|nr:hypothetical protein K525DRAFT_256767 [Schizophyllum commune Loenen D]KAI5824074.1 hypothetical protein K523DRAFT_357144 [Schizophyllum commune Tattone D]